MAARAIHLPAEQPQVTRFGVPPPPAHELLVGLLNLAVSPDGRHLVYNTRLGDEGVLCHRDLSGIASREIPGTRGGRAPFFSPDGRRLGFFRDGQLLAVPLAGGTPLPLAPVNGYLWGAAWSEDGSVIFGGGYPSALFRARPGGAVERLTQVTPGRGLHHFWPRVLPGGKAIIFTVWTNTLWDARTEWLSLVTGERHTVLTGASDCRYASGLLVCGRAGGTIDAALFDPERGRLTGPMLPLLSDVEMGAMGYSHMAVAGRTLIYLPGASDTAPRTLQRLVSGTPSPLPVPPRLYRNFHEGPGGKAAVTILDRGRSDVWVVDTASGKLSRLTFERFNLDPVWSPDGQWVAFSAREENGPFNVYRRRADGSGAVERLLASQWDQHPAAWSPDGRELMLVESHPTTGFDLWVLDLTTRKARPWQRTPASEMHAAWSPDGKWVAYTSAETGRWEVYVRSYPDGAGRWQISQDIGESPSWSADGRTIYFHKRRRLASGLKLWSVPVDPRGRELSPGTPTKVYESPTLLLGAAGPGGVMLLTAAPPPPKPSEVRVMLEWPSAVR